MHTEGMEPWGAWRINVESSLPEVLNESQGLPALVAHEADSGLVHHLVQDHQVVVLQLLGAPCNTTLS